MGKTTTNVLRVVDGVLTVSYKTAKKVVLLTMLIAAGTATVVVLTIAAFIHAMQ